jgi:glutaredoxin
MKTRTILAGCLLLVVSLVFSGCPKEAPEPKVERKSGEVPAPGEAPDGSGLVDLQKARDLLKNNKFEDLLGTFEPDQVEGMMPEERSVLADLFHDAASRLKERFKNVSFSSLYCERGLMLAPQHQPLLRLQIQNYLHPEMKLFGGAEELADKLLAIDAESAHNQLLRGKAAFEQGEYDVAVLWLKKAARVGRRKRGAVIEEAWKLLDLAQGKQQEIKAALSMTRELEAMMARAKKRGAKLPAAAEPKAADVAADLSGGSITLYMTRWCGYCRKARKLLKGMNVKFEEKDIEKDQSALMEMMRYAEDAGIEVTGVPVLRIGNQMVVGYNPQRIESLVAEIR